MRASCVICQQIFSKNCFNRQFLLVLHWFLFLAPKWRLLSLMNCFAKNIDDRARQSLRLASRIWAQIDLARAQRAGSVSRNTWITEAIEEKIAREQQIPVMTAQGERRRV